MAFNPDGVNVEPSLPTAKPVVAPPQKPRETIQVEAVRPERDALEIKFPRVAGYRVELPTEKLEAKFDEIDSVLELTPDLVGATETQNEGIIGEKANLNLVHTNDTRSSEVLYKLTTHRMVNLLHSLMDSRHRLMFKCHSLN
jgi:type III restriction enzyme